jgi:DNA polymerase III psi subunit
MIESQRRAYLEVLGFDVWLARSAGPESGRLLIQPGDGDTLLVSASAELTSGPFASDVVRALGGKAVWAWPDPEGLPDNPTLEEAIGQFLFTRIILFGVDRGSRWFKGEVPLVVGSARILVSDSLETLAVDGTAKRTLWNQVSGKSHN